MQVNDKFLEESMNVVKTYIGRDDFFHECR